MAIKIPVTYCFAIPKSAGINLESKVSSKSVNFYFKALPKLNMFKKLIYFQRYNLVEER